MTTAIMPTSVQQTFIYAEHEKPAEALAGEIRVHLEEVNYHEKRADYHRGKTSELLFRASQYFKTEKRFMQYCAANFKQSYSTIGNYVNIARTAPPVLIDAPEDKVTTSFLLTISRGSPEDWRLQSAVEMAETQRLDRSAGQIIRYGTERQVKALQSGDLPSGKTLTAQAIEQINAMRGANYEEVRHYCRLWELCRPEQVLYARELFDRAKSTRFDERPSVSWSMLIEDRGLLNGVEWSKLLRDCDPTDIERHKRDRRLLAMESKTAPAPNGYEWVTTFVTVTNETHVAFDPRSGVSLHTGDVVMVKVRVPRV